VSPLVIAQFAASLSITLGIVEQSRESFYEWFQWLVDRLKERERHGRGAHERYKTWKE
jgi:hypothetical protein